MPPRRRRPRTRSPSARKRAGRHVATRRRAPVAAISRRRTAGAAWRWRSIVPGGAERLSGPREVEPEAQSSMADDLGRHRARARHLPEPLEVPEEADPAAFGNVEPTPAAVVEPAPRKPADEEEVRSALEPYGEALRRPSRPSGEPPEHLAWDRRVEELHQGREHGRQVQAVALLLGIVHQPIPIELAGEPPHDDHGVRDPANRRRVRAESMDHDVQELIGGIEGEEGRLARVDL